MRVYQGVVKDTVIVLSEGVRLEEGTQVEVRPLAHPDLSEDALEYAFEQRLVDKGLLAEIKEPQTVLPQRDRTPIKAEGKTLSQTIIEERR